MWLVLVGEDFVPTPASLLSFLGSQARKVLVFKRRERSGFSPFGLDTLVPHRQEMHPTHGLYALGATMSVPLLHV